MSAEIVKLSGAAFSPALQIGCLLVIFDEQQLILFVCVCVCVRVVYVDKQTMGHFLAYNNKYIGIVGQ